MENQARLGALGLSDGPLLMCAKKPTDFAKKVGKLFHKSRSDRRLRDRKQDVSYSDRLTKADMSLKLPCCNAKPEGDDDWADTEDGNDALRKLYNKSRKAKKVARAEEVEETRNGKENKKQKKEGKEVGEIKETEKAARAEEVDETRDGKEKKKQKKEGKEVKKQGKRQEDKTKKTKKKKPDITQFNQKDITQFGATIPGPSESLLATFYRFRREFEMES